MNKLQQLSLVPIAALVLSSCSQPQLTVQKADLVAEKQTQAPTNYIVYPDDRPSIPDGQEVWNKMNCASCHGEGGKGGSAKIVLADTAEARKRKPVDTYTFLAFGKDSHPPYLQKMSNREVWNLVVYTRSLGLPALTNEELAAIQPIFGANCAVCHGTKGDGDGPLARNLEPLPANFQIFKRFYDRNDETLWDHIANGIKWEGMPNFLGKEDKKKNFKFDTDNINKLVLYVRNFHISNTATIPLSAAGLGSKPAEAAPAQDAAAPATSAPATTTSSTAAPAATPDGASTGTGGDEPPTDSGKTTGAGETGKGETSPSGSNSGEAK